MYRAGLGTTFSITEVPGIRNGLFGHILEGHRISSNDHLPIGHKGRLGHRTLTEQYGQKEKSE
ncbi:MAG: hypothetical protein ACJAX1_003108 [Neolewinella sp.]